MDEEIVDVVDENNTIIYQATKQEAHQNGLLHRTVIGEIYDPEGRWILASKFHGGAGWLLVGLIGAVGLDFGWDG